MNGRKVDIMETGVSDMVIKLRRGQEIKCLRCKKGKYVTKQGYTERAWSFWCDNCGDLLHVDPVESIVN